MPAKFKFHFKTARFLSPVSIVALSCSCVADAPPKSGQLVDATQTRAIERTLILAANDATPLPVAVAAADSKLRYMGRFDWRDAAGPRCAWSASTVSLKFRGTDLNVKIKDTDSNRWQVEVDGKPNVALQMRAGEHLYRVVSGLANGEHTVRLIRATEAFCGVSQFTGFQLNEGGKLLALAAPKRRLEVIGDSISAGYGNEAPNQNEKFSPKTENAYFTSGAMTARSVGADYTCIAWSGRKMWPNNTIPEIYDRVLPQDTSSAWDFSKQATPDVILINLATNDFNAKEKPEQEGWVKAYRDFIGRLRKNAPDATIYCALSPMLIDDWPPTVKIRSQARGYIQRVVKESNEAGDKKVRYLEFETQNPANGLGADWHPSIKTNQIMADTILTALKTDLGWQPAP